MSFRDRILKEMLESPEDEVVRRLRNEKGFNEDFVRKIFKELKHDAFCTLNEKETKNGN